MGEPKRILIVDDTEENLELLETIIGSLGHKTEVARDGFEALAKLRLDVDLVFLDITLPGLDGFQVASKIRKQPEHADLPIVMVTPSGRKDHQLRAMQVGANDFVSSPVDKTELRMRTTSLLKMKQAQDEFKRQMAELDATVQRRTQELRRALEEQAEAQRQTYRAYLEALHRLGISAEYRDEEKGVHYDRMAAYCALLGRAIGLSPGEVGLLKVASPMHDMGKIGIPDSILLKQDKLTQEEWQIMKGHTTIGGQILAGSSSDLIQAGEVIAVSHHERWDGGGYPHGLSGKEIPLHGRICKVADVFDTVTNPRPYGKPLPNEQATAILEKGSGNHFDPELVEAFLANLKNVATVQQRFLAGHVIPARRVRAQ